jgi:uncharacterized damage-inducible protein DinB
MKRVAVAAAFAALLALAQQKIPQEIGKGWMPEFDHASYQLNALAEATPADKFGWRPGAGVRSVSEVYMHIVLGNYFLLGQAGAKVPANIKADMETTVTSKADVIKALKDSQTAVRAAYPTIDQKKKVNFLSGPTTAEGVLLRLLVHNHEHMGQSIAYARMVGVTPPWSQ